MPNLIHATCFTSTTGLLLFAGIVIVSICVAVLVSCKGVELP